MRADGASADGARLRRLIMAGPWPSPGQADAQPRIVVLTGGQTGVDTLAAITALGAGLAVHMAFPRGYGQEDGPLTPARRRRLAGAVLSETGSAEFRVRTWACVCAADAVILLDPAGGDGCQQTRDAAARISRPLLEPGPGAIDPADVAWWLASHRARIVMVAGCRGSLLAAAGQEGAVHGQIAAVIAGARLRHDQGAIEAG
jgi:Circularly permutated YpsA SLOG family